MLAAFPGLSLPSPAASTTKTSSQPWALWMYKPPANSQTQRPWSTFRLGTQTSQLLWAGKHTLSPQLFSARNHSGVLCYHPWHGALSEDKLLKIQLAGKHSSLHTQILCAWVAKESFNLPHTETTLLAFPLTKELTASNSSHSTGSFPTPGHNSPYPPLH